MLTGFLPLRGRMKEGVSQPSSTPFPTVRLRLTAKPAALRADLSVRPTGGRGSRNLPNEPLRHRSTRAAIHDSVAAWSPDEIGYEMGSGLRSDRRWRRFRGLRRAPHLCREGCGGHRTEKGVPSSPEEDAKTSRTDSCTGFPMRGLCPRSRLTFPRWIFVPTPGVPTNAVVRRGRRVAEATCRDSCLSDQARARVHSDARAVVLGSWGWSRSAKNALQIRLRRALPRAPSAERRMFPFTLGYRQPLPGT
jgi:hypothetical protein